MEGILGTNNTVGLVYLSPIGIGTKPFLCFEIHGCVSGCILNRLRPPHSLLKHPDAAQLIHIPYWPIQNNGLDN